MASSLSVLHLEHKSYQHYHERRHARTPLNVDRIQAHNPIFRRVVVDCHQPAPASDKFAHHTTCGEELMSGLCKPRNIAPFRSLSRLLGQQQSKETCPNGEQLMRIGERPVQSYPVLYRVKDYSDDDSQKKLTTATMRGRPRRSAERCWAL
ncbi:hypothetical protein D9613_004627 [Agrocybe pediades]|uniref:Uncharacterized protein n=1 Tax=Agrocybe pediades TaxID=84607 RepID=A0A8H4VLK4_9AGAR|nr:hypothetical protein D9613_004627 [Agrocybe pediades]